MIENCTFTNLDFQGGTLLLTDADKLERLELDAQGRGATPTRTERQYIYREMARVERQRWARPDCRWLPEPVEVVR